MLQVMQYGNWKVIPEVGFYKKTNITTYTSAKWEMHGGRLPKRFFSFRSFCRSARYSLRYHWIALLNIKYSISTLNINNLDKLFLNIVACWRIIAHFLSLSLGFKRSRYVAKKEEV